MSGKDGANAVQYIHSDGGGADEFPRGTTKVSQSFRTKTEYHIRTSTILHLELEPDERDNQYVTDLRILARTCEFAALKDSLIRDRMVCGVANTRFTERLLRTTDMDLEKAITICRAAESSQEQLRVIEGDNDRGVEAVATRPKQAQQSARQPPSGNHGDPYACSRCGRFHSQGHCPVTGKV